MFENIRNQLRLEGATEATIKRFESAIKQDAKAKHIEKLNQVEMRVMEQSETASTWRLKFLKTSEEKVEFEQRVGLLEKRIALSQKAILNLSAYVKKCRAAIFGDKSERRSPPARPANAESKQGKKKRGKQRGTKGFGRASDTDIPLNPVPHDISDEQKQCKCGAFFDLTDLPPETSEETHIIEELVRLLHSKRKVIRKCSSCGRNGGIVTAKRPPSVIPKSKYSTQVWRYLLEEKFWLQRPINRILRKFRSLGICARPSTFNNGFRLLFKAELFQPIYEEIVDRSRVSELRHMDETGWKVFGENELKDSNRWYMWVSVTSDTTVFLLDPSKSNEVIHAHLEGVAEGIIVCDRAKPYQKFGRDKKGFLIAFCWIHQRRDFLKLETGFPQHHKWTDDWLARIDAIIIQNKIRLNALSNPDEFKAEDKVLRKMIDKFEKKFQLQLNDSSLEEEQLACIRSLSEHWHGLTVFVNFPHVPMSNNEAERALRNAVLGRKSYYGSRAHWSGLLASFLFTIYATLEQNQINPMTWMDEYLEVCAKNNGKPPPDRILKNFLPWNYKPASKQEPVKHSEETRINFEELRVTILHDTEPIPV
jgi:transposase